MAFAGNGLIAKKQQQQQQQQRRRRRRHLQQLLALALERVPPTTIFELNIGFVYFDEVSFQLFLNSENFRLYWRCDGQQS